MKRKYKYLHIVYQDGGGQFVSKLLASFDTPEYHTDINEHLWVTNDCSLFDHWHSKRNVLYSDKDMTSQINRYGSKADWIFIHGISTPFYRVCFIKPWFAKKIIWRTWGHDIRIPTNDGTVIKRLVKSFFFSLYKKMVKRFRLVGVANIVDELKVKEYFGNKIPTINIPYGISVDEWKKRDNFLCNSVSNYKKPDDICRIMIGHSAYPIDNHIHAINKIERFKDEKILVYVMLPYGQGEYAETVKTYARSALGDKCVIVDKMKPFEEFFSFILTMDIAIFDMQDSAALGCLSYLVYTHKKLFLRDGGDIRKAFDYAGLSCNSIDDLDNISFESFSSPAEYDVKKACFALAPSLLNANYPCDTWNSIFESLVAK